MRAGLARMVRWGWSGSEPLERAEGPGIPVSIVRPTYVAGPYDHTRRFTWWVERVARGCPVLAPGREKELLALSD